MSILLPPFLQNFARFSPFFCPFPANCIVFRPSPKMPRTVRAQVWMKDCRRSTRKPYTIRRGAISAIEKRDFPWETRTGAFPYLRNPGLQRINGNAENFPHLPCPLFPFFGLRPRCARSGRQVGMKNRRVSDRKAYTIRHGRIPAIKKRDCVETQSVSYLRNLGL